MINKEVRENYIISTSIYQLINHNINGVRTGTVDIFPELVLRVLERDVSSIWIEIDALGDVTEVERDRIGKLVLRALCKMFIKIEIVNVKRVGFFAGSKAHVCAFIGVRDDTLLYGFI